MATIGRPNKHYEVKMGIVTAAIIEKDGKVLIARRKAGEALEHKWEFPGGKLELGETPEECLRRELFEEFGIESEIKDYICTVRYEYEHASIELQAYRVIHRAGEFVLNSHDRILWVEPEELPSFDLAEADKIIVKRLLMR